ncbi:YitT family protein, partial [Paenibacillus sp. EKM208P]
MFQLNPPAARRRRRKPLIAASGPARNVTDILLIILGSFITALTFNMFLLPNRIASGGVSGLSILGE